MAPQTAEQRGCIAQQAAAPRGWLLYLLALGSLVYALALAWHYTHHSLMWLDEFFAWNLLQDPSWRHAYRAWQNGADGGGPLFYVINRLIVAMVPSPAAVRLCSLLCTWAAACVLVQVLRSHVRPFAAVVATLFVWSTSLDLFVHAVEVRFYGLLLLAAALTLWTADRSALGKLSPRSAFALSWLANAVLLLSHVLGIVYSALILAAFLLSPARRARLTYLSGTLLSWPVFLVMRRAIQTGARNAPTSYAPSLQDLLRLYRNLPYGPPELTHLLRMGPALAVLILLVLVWVSRCGYPAVQSSFRLAHLTRHLLPLSLLSAPLVLYLASLIAHPILLDRYLLPYTLAFTAALAFALDKATAGLQPRMLTIALAAALPFWIALHLATLRDVPFRSPHQLDGLKQQAKSIGTWDLNLFFQAQFYASSPTLQFFYLGPMAPADPPSIQKSIAAAGYWPGTCSQSRPSCVCTPRPCCCAPNNSVWAKQPTRSAPHLREPCRATDAPSTFSASASNLGSRTDRPALHRRLTTCVQIVRNC